MFANGFEFRLPEAGARYRQDEIRSKDLMILRQRPEGGVVDESFDRPRAPRRSEWTRLRVVLGGVHQANVGGGIVLERAGAYASSEAHRQCGRSVSHASDFVDLYWRSGSVAGGALASAWHGELASSSLARVEALARALETRDVATTIATAREVLLELRAHGLPVEPDALDRETDEAPDVARVLWDVAGDLTQQPMAIDLSRALGISERHALRCANRYFRQYCLSASSWREFIGALRVEMGTFFMGAAGARTEDVSRLLGFSSPTAFCHALEDAGLPSPQRLKKELLAA